MTGVRGRALQKSILITGGAGFLGSHLAQRLIGDGHHVVCLDNFHTGRAANVAHLSASNRFASVEHDITTKLPNHLPRFDEIYNLACPASPIHYQQDPIKTLMVCSTGVMHVLERASHDRARLFHASTSEVYGDPDVHPQTESYFGNVNTVGPRSCYDEGKRFAETLLTDFASRHGLTLRMVRIFNTYGPRMQPDDGRVVSNFIIQALKGKDITVYGDGSQTRSFCYVDDMIEGFIRLMAADEPGARPVNIGNPVETKVGDLAERIVRMANSRSRIVYKPLPADDPRRRRPDISRAEETLNWRPTVDLADGLTSTIAFFAGEIGLAKDVAERSLELTA